MKRYRFDNAAVFCSNTASASIMHYLHHENKGFKTGRTLSRRDGIHAFCIRIDEEARVYLPHMYGAANNKVIDDVASLPVKVSDICRRLTS